MIYTNVRSPHQKRHILAKKANFKKLAIEFAKRKTLSEMHQSLLLQISRPISWQFQGIELHSVKNVLWSPLFLDQNRTSWLMLLNVQSLATKNP